MARTIILGGKNTEDLAIQLEAELIEVPDLYASDLGAINDFVICRLKQNFDVLVIDVDNIQRPDVALALGLYLRLSFAELGASSLVPIIIASDKRIKSFLHFVDYSQLLLTENVYFQPRTEIIIQAVSPLDTKKYKTDFLDFINVNSGPEIGRHSLANQWGASVLSRMISVGSLPQNDSLIKAQKSLYFKYVFAKTVGSIEPYMNLNNDNTAPKTPIDKVDAHGKNILLIDDEADKGWSDVLDSMFIGKISFDVIKERVPDYSSLSADARKMIEKGDYDLIFLDLRMNGIAEENNLEPEKFSGMDILKKIKTLNEGTQVIILTASNKAWNLKALLDAGADGYYTKESPELLFPHEVSYGNCEALQKTINRCFERGYLRKIVESIGVIKQSLPQNDFGNAISKQLDIAFYLISRAETKEQYAFAYISLYQIIEIITENMIMKVPNPSAPGTSKWIFHDCTYLHDYIWDSINKSYQDKGDAQSGKDLFPQWKKMAGLIFQQWNIQNADKFVRRLYQLIEKRNGFVHNDRSILDRQDINNNFVNHDIYRKDGFQKLFDSLKIIFSNI